MAAVILPPLLIPPASPELALLQLARLKLRSQVDSASGDDVQPVGCASCGALQGDTRTTTIADDGGSGPSKRPKTSRSTSRQGKKDRHAAASCLVCGETSTLVAERMHPTTPTRPRTRRSSTIVASEPPALSPTAEPSLLLLSSVPRKPPVGSSSCGGGDTPSALLSPTLAHVPLSEPETPSIAPPPSPPVPEQTTSQGSRGSKGRGKATARGKRRSPLASILAVGGTAAGANEELRVRHSTRLNR